MRRAWIIALSVLGVCVIGLVVGMWLMGNSDGVWGHSGGLCPPGFTTSPPIGSDNSLYDKIKNPHAYGLDTAYKLARCNIDTDGVMTCMNCLGNAYPDLSGPNCWSGTNLHGSVIPPVWIAPSNTSPLDYSTPKQIMSWQGGFYIASSVKGSTIPSSLHTQCA
jgi:hypothetical protein